MADLHKHMLLNVALRNPPREPEQVKEWLSRVVTKVRMKQMREPWAGWDDTPNNEGVTGDVILTTSHCSIHVWNNVEPAYAKLDLYSCAEFDPAEFLEMVMEFDPYWYEYLVVDRTRFGFQEVARESKQVIPMDSLLDPYLRDVMTKYLGQSDLVEDFQDALCELNRLHRIYGVNAPQA